MAAIEKDKFIITDQKYNSGFTIDEYNGKISIVNARQADDGRAWVEWCYPQKRKDGENVPHTKALPWKILLGADRAEAVRSLKSLLAIVSDVPSEGDYTQSAPPATESDNIPF